MMNDIFSDMRDLGIIAYIDDVLIYVKTQPEHNVIVRETLKRLQKTAWWLQWTNTFGEQQKWNFWAMS